MHRGGKLQCGFPPRLLFTAPPATLRRATFRRPIIRTDTRTNEEITAREVRLIDETGKQHGIIPLGQALERASSRQLDLVEVAPEAVPPVCRIMDYTKYVYELKRKQKLAKKKGHRQETKEIKLRPNIDPHDFGIKVKHAREFLEKGDKVKLTVRYRQREMRHFEIGTRIINKLIEDLKELALVESQSRGGEGVRMQVAVLAPRKVPAGVTKDE